MVKLMVFIALCAIIIILTMLYLTKFLSDIIIHTAVFQTEKIEEIIKENKDK